MRTNADSLSEKLVSCKSQRNSIDAGLVRISEERKELRAQVEKFEELATQSGVPIDDTTILYVAKGYSALQEEQRRRRREIEQFNERMQTARAQIEHIQEEIEQTLAKKSETTVSLGSTQKDLTGLREDPRSARVSLDIELGQLAEFERRNAEETTAISAELRAADNAVALANAKLTSIRKEEDLRQAELDGLRNRVAQSKTNLTELDARLEEAGLRRDVDESTVLGEIARQSHTHAVCLRLRDQALALELAIDRVTTAAVLTQLRQNLQDKQRLIATAKQNGIRHASWLKYFGVIAGLISSQRNEATEDFTREYGRVLL